MYQVEGVLLSGFFAFLMERFAELFGSGSGVPCERVDYTLRVFYPDIGEVFGIFVKDVVTRYVIPIPILARPLGYL